MNATLIATAAGLATALCWGIADWTSARSTKNLKPIEVNFAVQIASILVVALVAVFWNVHVPNDTQLLKMALAGALYTVAYLAFVKSLSSGLVGVVSPIGNSYALVTVALSAIFLTLHFSPLQFGAMVAIVLGAVLLSYEKNTKQVPLRQLHKQTILAVIAMASWGVEYFILGTVSDEIPWPTLLVSVEIFMTAYALILLLLFHEGKIQSAIRRTATSKYGLITGTIGTFGGLFLYLGADYSGSIVIPTVLSAGASLVASVWGAIFEGERLGVMKRVGAVVIVAGVIVLNLP